MKKTYKHRYKLKCTFVTRQMAVQRSWECGKAGLGWELGLLMGVLAPLWILFP